MYYQVDATDARPKVDRYLPFPFNSENQAILQQLQVLAPIVGLGAACLHTYYYGLTVGAFAMAALLAVLGGLGVTVGFHRLFTHRSFEATPWTRNILVMLGSMAAQHHFFLWVANHRRHHHFSDHEGDPHSPHSLDLKKEGRWSALFRSHISWVFSSKLSDDDLHYIPDLTSNIALCRIQRLYVLWIGLGLLAPALVCYFIGGTLQAAVGGMLWGGFARMFLSTQTTNAVNSICHMWGGQPYDSHDFSRNNGTVAMLSLGEGWHNNHHAFPTSARHGLLKGQFDFSWSVIKLLRRCGLAWNVKTPTPKQLRTRLRKRVADDDRF